MQKLLTLLIIMSISLSAYGMDAPIKGRIPASDESALEYCRNNPRARISIIWPRAYDKAERMKEMLAACGSIVYEKDLELYNNGPSHVFKTAQPRESDENVAKWIKDYIPAHLQMPYSFKAVMFETDLPLDQIIAIKREIRKYAGADWCSIHIDDSNQESHALAQFVFEENPDNLFKVLKRKLNRWVRSPRLCQRYVKSSIIQVAQEFAKIGGDLNRKTSDGLSLLHMAAQEDEVKLINSLAAQGADVESVTHCGDTPLIKAAQKGSMNSMHALLQADAAIDKPNNYGNTALACASIHGQTRAVQQLVSAGADVHKKDNEKRTPLAQAVSCAYRWPEQPKVVAALLRAGARTQERDAAQHNVLMLATLWTCNLSTFANIVEQSKSIINAKDPHGKTALFLAIEGLQRNPLFYNMHYKALCKERCEREVHGKVQLLLEAGALVNEKTNDGKSALMEARKIGCQAIIKALLDAGAFDGKND